VTKKIFTIIELVIVLAIVGALTALSVTYYLDSQQLSKMHTFEANINKIVETLNIYKSNKVLLGVQLATYPQTLNDSDFKALFAQEPINPYTGKSMLSNNPEESGLRYENHDNDYTLCVTQLDVDDVDKDGNKDELLPIKIHIAKGDVCNNTESTQCPVKVNNAIAIIQILGSEDYYTSDNQSRDPWLKERECLPTPSNIIRGSYEQGVSDNLVKKGKYGQILPKSYVDTTSTQININDNNIWQTSGNVVFNDNSVIIGNNSSATTTNILLISSNMADEKFTEFVVDIPEVSTGTIQIGLRDYYLQISRSPFGIGTEICRVNAYDVNFPTPWCGGVPRNYVGRHTFRIVDKNDIWNVERSLYIDGEYISNDYVEYTHLRDNPEYFYITNMNTNSQVILERLETGTNNYVLQILALTQALFLEFLCQMQQLKSCAYIQSL